MKKWLHLIIPAIFAFSILGALKLPKSDPAQFDAVEFGSLPVLSNGRIQPLDSLARNSLLQIRGKQEANLEPWKPWWKGPKMMPGAAWLAEVMMNPDAADTRPIFRIDNPDCKGLLGLPMNADDEKQLDGKHFTFNQIKGKLETLEEEWRRVKPIDASKRTPFDQAVAKLYNAVGIYMQLENTLEPQNARDWPKELDAFLNNIEAGVAAVRAQKANQTYDRDAADRLLTDLERFDAMAKSGPPMLIPPAHPENSREEWQRTDAVLMDAVRGEHTPFALLAYARMAGAYRGGRVSEFNQAVAGYRSSLEDKFTPELKKASHEQFFNFYAPFIQAMPPYLCAFILVLLFWLSPESFDWARKAAVGLVVVGLCAHTSGLLFRMFLEGRPPVTNLYSSAIFIGFGAVILGLVLEMVWRNGIGLVISSVLGFVTLIIAHHLSLSGDTMEMMRAVLDTNIWLATHVVVVTLGYASTFVAGFLALLYIVLGLFTPNLKKSLSARQLTTAAMGAGLVAGGVVGATAGAVAAKAMVKKGESLELGKALPKMVYGIVCFATLFSFVGTVLGGIWADQSWGRFWGWDPKENGALIIVLWNALILHARWGGLVRERGLICLAVGGNIVTSWSWFGVNMLGIGLHSYGFTSGEAIWLGGFVASQLVFIGLGNLPLRMWRSFRDEEKPAVPTADSVATATA